MFFLLAVLAMIGYAFQGALIASCYRRLDRLSVVAYRGMALGIGMAPLLFFAGPIDPAVVRASLPWIIASAAVASFGNWCGANAYSFLPLGIASAIFTSLAAIVAVVLSWAALGERLSPAQLAWIALILLGVVLLSAARSTGPLPRDFDLRRGIVHATLYGILLGIAYVILGRASRQVHPFLAGFAWELAIGIFAAAIAVARGWAGDRPLVAVSPRDFGKIFAFASPSILGTACFTMAMRLGPMGIATAIVSTMIVVKTLLAMALYRERPTVRQWCLLAAICATVVGLKLAS